MNAVANSQGPSYVPGQFSYATATASGLGKDVNIRNVQPSTSTSSDLSNDIENDGGLDTSIFTTAKPEGAFRDEIVVEINSIDGVPYRGTVTTKEAVKTIFMDKLGFVMSDLGSLTIGYSMGRIITFKLRNQFNIDQLESVENFDFKRMSKNRSGENIESNISCKIRGIRKLRVNNNTFPDTYADEGYRWVKIEGCEYRVTKQEIHDWLVQLGEVCSDITEDKLECNFDSDNEGEEGDQGLTIGSGTYSVKMKLARDIPQFVPMCGKRIRLYHKGIVKLCTNCFGTHQRKSCTVEKVSWIDYVDNFMRAYPSIPEHFYGKWFNIVKNRRDSTIDTQQPSLPTGADGPSQGSQLAPTSNGAGPINTQQLQDQVVKPLQKNPTKVTTPDSALLTRLRNQGLDVSTTVINKQATPETLNEPSRLPLTSGSNSTKTSRGRGRGGRSANQKTQ